MQFKRYFRNKNTSVFRENKNILFFRSFDEIIEMWNNDTEIKELRMEMIKEEYEWALEHNKILLATKKISIDDLKSDSFCGENTSRDAFFTPLDYAFGCFVKN